MLQRLNWRGALASAAVFMLGVGPALADHDSGGAPGAGSLTWGGAGGAAGSGGAASAPEIDLTQGLGIIVILICAALILRERFLRTQR